jgi:hypothetical protein
MNGCCVNNSECSCHSIECTFRWPCGCAKQRLVPGGLASSHVHKYEEKRRKPQIMIVDEEDIEEDIEEDGG